MEPFVDGDLRIEVDSSEARVVLSWRGKSNGKSTDDTLRPFFERVAEEAARAHAPVEMRFGALEYFNSSTIAALIRMIRRLGAQNTPTKVLYAESSWQRRSFEALRVLERDGLVEIRGE